MKMLGLNPLEQEIIDLTNNIVKNGFIYFPDFCKVIHEKYRQDDEELFHQHMFKVSSMKSITSKNLWLDHMWNWTVPREI